MSATPFDLNQHISAEQKESIRAPIHDARTLPRQAFINQDFFEIERNSIFSNQWLAVGFEEQLKDSGDILPIDFANIPLIIVRDDEGYVRAFHNVVPYDGCLAVLNPLKQAESITTPYHGWQFNLKGKLIAAPFWSGHEAAEIETLTHHKTDLIEVACSVFCGVVFIYLGKNPPEFEEKLRPLKSALHDYRVTDLAIGRDSNNGLLLDRENIKTNWKTHYENWALNVLHEGFTHSVYRDSDQIPRVDKQANKNYKEHIDGDLMAMSYKEQDFEETYELEDLPMAHIGVDPEKLPENAFIGSFFPNLHLAVFPFFIHMIIVFPQSAGETHTLRAQFYDKHSAIDTDAETTEERVGLQAEFQEASEEDARVTEAVQKARYSPAFEQQFYSPFWDNMHYTFSNQVLDALEAHSVESKETL